METILLVNCVVLAILLLAAIVRLLQLYRERDNLYECLDSAAKEIARLRRIIFQGGGGSKS